MKTNLSKTDYVIYDKANDQVLLFSDGDIVIFGNKDEADEDCRVHEVVIPCTELPIHWKKILLNQINNQSK